MHSRSDIGALLRDHGLAPRRDLGQNFVDRFARNQVALVEEERYPDLKSELPQRNVDKVLEPVIVVAVVGGLVALFFQNRP